MLTAPDLALLGRLGLVYRRPVRGAYAGERRSRRTSRSAEFADFRPYAPGDDFRQIDWRAFARLDRLTVRLYVADDEASLNLVVDASGSMALGTPAKWVAARRLVAALALLGLAGMDRVIVGVLGDAARTPALRGKARAGRAWSFLEGLAPDREALPPDAAGLAWTRPGMTVIVSDFLIEDIDWAGLLSGLCRRGQEPVLWQILAGEEESPRMRGDLELVEAETSRRRELTITSGLVADYLAALAEHRDHLRRAAAAAGGRFLNTISSDDLGAELRAAA
ncbi:MAG: DUF58 domain-containing protein, partial [Candidatus Dormibacteraceae bacterium]